MCFKSSKFNSANSTNLNILVSLFQPALLKAIFNVDPDEVRSLIFKKEDVNTQVIPAGPW